MSIAKLPIEQKHWHALYVNSRAEKKVMDMLLSKNIEAYVPIVKVMKQWSDRKKRVEVPLFNGYVFVNILNSQNEAVLQTKGVVNFVRHVGKIAIVREVEINRLKQIVDLGYHIELSNLTQDYKEGDKIKILSGPLKNMEGFVFKKNNEQFVEVVLESIGQNIRVKLLKEMLDPVK
jgi:transcription antitermination factor NusG